MHARLQTGNAISAMKKGITPSAAAERKFKSARQIRTITEAEEPTETISILKKSVDEYWLTVSQKHGSSPQIVLRVNGETIVMTIDSGAPKDAIDEITFNQFVSKPKLKIDTARALAYQQTSPLLENVGCV
jgi:hypothetical protein